VYTYKMSSVDNQQQTSLYGRSVPSVRGKGAHKSQRYITWGSESK